MRRPKPWPEADATTLGGGDGFRTDFALRRLFYFTVAAPERQMKIEVAEPKERAEFLRRLIASTIPDIPDSVD